MKLWVRLVLLVVILVVSVLTIILVIRNWDIVIAFIGYCIVASVIGGIVFYMIRDSAGKRYATLITLGTIAIVMYFGCRSISFGIKIHRLEQKFIVAANSESYWIERDGKLSYGGELDNILFERDELLRDYHYRIDDDSWWVTKSPDRTQISGSYHWSPFGL